MFEKNKKAMKKLQRAIEGFMIGLEIDIIDAVDSFPFKRLGEVLRIYEFYSLFDSIKPKMVKALNEAMKKQNFSKEKAIELIGEKLNELGKPNLKNKIINWFDLGNKIESSNQK